MTADPVKSQRGGTMSKRGLARALGLSPSAVLKLEARGMPLDSVEAARAWRLANLDPMRTKASGARAERIGRTDALMDARIEREQAEAALANLRLAELSGELVRVADVKRELARTYVSLRDALLNIPHRMAPLVAAESDQARVFAMLETELRQTLEQLTQGNPAKPLQDSPS